MSTQNRLANSSSPYLQQHANNPVDWYTWDTEALDRARKEKKPILLSVGYSACHWCHVMAHESFEDEATAEMMNKYFINIKVDREQRPDIDKIYQTSHSLLTQRGGGWPLTVFLDYRTHAPFFSGTYFPKEPRHGLPSFREVLMSIADYFNSHLDDISKQGEEVSQTLKKMYAPRPSQSSLPPNLTNTAYQTLERLFDAEYGGFGEAPKFPQVSQLSFLVHCAEKFSAEDKTTEAIQASGMALHTLRCMILSGVYDQVGGGFYRYAVDRAWLIPHFEKMLYDNGLLLSFLAEASTLIDEDLFRHALHETAQWALRDMQSPAGAFYSSLDADSEGEEGLYYTWSQQEMMSLLDSDTLNTLKEYWNINTPANFEGSWHLNTINDDIRKQDKQQLIEKAKVTLLATRTQRISPHLDDKILTSWNALMIKGMAKAAMASEEKTYADGAWRAFEFIHKNLWDGQYLFSSCRKQQIEKISYLDDYAFLLDACLSLLQLRWDANVFEFANTLADALIDQFEDSTHGGFFFTPHQHEKLLERPRTFYDEAIPSGYAVAVYALSCLGALCGKDKYLNSAKRALEQAGEVLQRNPAECASLLYAANLNHAMPSIVVLRGAEESMRTWQQIARQNFSSSRLCFAIPASFDLSNNFPAITAKTVLAEDPNGVTAYICQGTTCLEPISKQEHFVEYLVQNSLKLKSE